MSEALNSFSPLPFPLELQGLLFFPPADATVTAVKLFSFDWFKKWTPVLTDYLYRASRQASDGSFPLAFQRWAVGLEPRQAFWSLDPESAGQWAKNPFVKSAKLSEQVAAAAHMTALLHLPSLQSRLPGRGREGAPPVWACVSKVCSHWVQSFTSPSLLMAKEHVPWKSMHNVLI